MAPGGDRALSTNLEIDPPLRLLVPLHPGLEPALQQITPNLEEVARTLGLGVRQTWQRVTLPLMRSGFVVAWVLMFLQTMKELPATLLLRPVGFDTLAIRVWMEASEEYYQLAAPSALLIVLLGLPTLLLLLSKDWRAA